MLLWSEQSEQGVIGAILFEPECVNDVLSLVQPADFYQAGHREIMQAISALDTAGEGIDAITVSSHCRNHAPLVGEIAANVASAANVRTYASTVRDYARRRSLIQACGEAIESAKQHSADDVAAELMATIEEAGQRAVGASLDFNDVLRAAVDAIDEASQTAAGGVIGVPTGIPLIDRATSGLCPRRLVVIAARPSIGKTALANQIALHAASKGYGIGVCSLEMGEEEIGTRSMAHRFQVNFTRLMRGHPDAVEKALTGMKAMPINQWPIYLDTSTYNLAGIEARICSWVRKHDIKAAFVDHIGLVEVEGDHRRVEKVGIVTRRLKKLAKRLNIAIVAVCQLNRSSEKENRRPRMSDLRDSGEIEQDMDVAICLHTDPDHISERVVPVEVGFIKNRTGRRGWAPEALNFDGTVQTFREQTTQWGVDHAA